MEDYKDYRNLAQTVISSVSCLDAAHAMGINTDYKGRCQCFFHGGDHRNLKIYGEDRGYYCFVCHAYGNVIDLVMKYQNISFMQAIEWLNDSFSLGLDFGGKAQRLSYKVRRSRHRKAEVYAKNAKATGS